MTPPLEAASLTFTYPASSVPVFHSFGLAVRAGEMLAVHGPSGCGKSTLLYLLGLFLRPTAGEVLLRGVATSRMGDRERSRLRAHDTGIVLQDALLHDRLTLVENVAEAALFSGARWGPALAAARERLEAVGLGAAADHLPSKVSGGQAQRAALCRALGREPSVVLADEPTGNLDPVAGGSVVGALRAAASSGAAVVVVTHAPAVIEACDRAVALA